MNTKQSSMISRKALLISAPGNSEKNVPILNSELEVAKNFLLSPEGGAWTEDEITILHCPTLKNVLRIVEEMQADYTITIFSGKGFPNKMGQHFLVLENGDFFEDKELLNNSAKQLVIIDDCSSETDIEVQLSEAAASDLGKARKIYDKWIETCDSGQMIMHATEEATVSPLRNKRGIFTRKLIQVASSIPPAIDRFNLKNILAMGHETPNLLLEEGFEEGPAVTYANGNVELPFALALPATVSLLPIIKRADFT